MNGKKVIAYQDFGQGGGRLARDSVVPGNQSGETGVVLQRFAQIDHALVLYFVVPLKNKRAIIILRRRMRGALLL